MIGFETRYGDGQGQEITGVQPHQVKLWCAAFDVDTLEALFDIEVAAKAIPIIDEAIWRFNHDPEPLRAVLDPGDALGLRGNRMVLEAMRRTLNDFPDATISGVVEH